METTTKRENLTWSRKNPKPTSCTLEWCSNKYYAKLLCRYHYERKRKGLSIEKKVFQYEYECEFEDCNKPACVKGYCKAHDMQIRTGRPLTSLRGFLVGVDANGRVCKDCEEYKTWDQYYVNSRAKVTPGISKASGHWSQCKTCARELQIARNRVYAESQKALTNG